jgi:hypothetical protein
MGHRSKSLNALKHGAYCESAVLPGESVAEFEQLYQDTIAEFGLDGPLELEIGWSIARLNWRKQHLGIYQRAKDAKELIWAIQSKRHPTTPFLPLGYEGKNLSEEELAVIDQEEKAARKALGKDLVLVEIGDIATTGHLLDELSIFDRLDASMDRCLKRLLMVRGIKSMKIRPS